MNETPKIKKRRDSNFELLRILATMLVMTVHLNWAAIKGNPVVGDLHNLPVSTLYLVGMESFFLIGLNIFALISGYFGIKARVSGFLKFLAICLFYSVGTATVWYLIFPEKWDVWQWLQSWMVFSRTDLWYIPAYMTLYVISPMLNAGIESIGIRKYGLVLGCFVAANMWGGWFWGGSLNPMGYNFVHILMMYLIGRYIALSPAIKEYPWKKMRRISGWVYFVAGAVTMVMGLLLPVRLAYANNSPWVLASSISFFMFFKSWKFYNPWINRLAGGSFSTYVIHKHPLVWVGFLVPLSSWAWRSWGPGGFFLYSTGMILGVYLFSAAVDYLRGRLFALFSRRRARTKDPLSELITEHS